MTTRRSGGSSIGIEFSARDARGDDGTDATLDLVRLLSARQQRREGYETRSDPGGRYWQYPHHRTGQRLSCPTIVFAELALGSIALRSRRPLPGEVSDFHPHDRTPERGVYAEIELHDPHDAELGVLFAGRRPFWVF